MQKNNVRELKTIKEIRVLNDPYRREIMSTLSAMGKPSTAKQVAIEMNQPPSKINYHMGILHQYDFIELHHTENVNGIIAKFYARSYTQFTVNMEDKSDDSQEMMAMSDIITSTFDAMRDEYIGTIRACKKDKCDKEELNDHLMMSKLYLNQEEFEELINIFESFKGRDPEGRELYSTLLSMINKPNKS